MSVAADWRAISPDIATFRSSVMNCVPAATTRSPRFSPSTTRTPSPVKSATVIVLLFTVSLSRSTTHTVVSPSF
ncbi:hypothetical protein D3C71_2208380 [compost metagenome]